MVDACCGLVRPARSFDAGQCEIDWLVEAAVACHGALLPSLLPTVLRSGPIWAPAHIRSY